VGINTNSKFSEKLVPKNSVPSSKLVTSHFWKYYNIKKNYTGWELVPVLNSGGNWYRKLGDMLQIRCHSFLQCNTVLRKWYWVGIGTSSTEKFGAKSKFGASYFLGVIQYLQNWLFQTMLLGSEPVLTGKNNRGINFGDNSKAGTEFVLSHH